MRAATSAQGLFALDDIQLALAASPQLGRLYSNAKALSVDSPAQSLLYLRGLAATFCQVLDQDFTARDSIEDRVKSLERRGLLRPQALRHLRTLQQHGNRSAHPEQYAHEVQDYLAMADASMAAARALCEQIFTLRNESVPDYQVIEPEQSGLLRDLCYMAMVKDDVEAIHQIGVFFKEKADQVEDLDTYVLADNYGDTARDHIDQAMFWFKRGAQRKHPGCQYAYGNYLANTRSDDRQLLIEGEGLILQAAEAEHADAMVYVAGSLLEGSGIFEKDLSLAREYYERAAAQGHPAALGQLGAIYEQGIGCEKNPVAAAKYTMCAAEAGYPQGQFNLFVLYLHGTGVESDTSKALRWLQLAVDQNFPAAVFNRACLAQQGLIEGEGLKEALALYHKLIGTADFHARAALAIAEITLATETGVESVMDAAVKLQDCHRWLVRDGDPYEIMEDCLASLAKAVRRLRDHIGTYGPDPKMRFGDVILCTHFDAAGVPVEDVAARTSEVFDLVEGMNSTRAGAKDRVIDQLLAMAHVALKVPTAGQRPVVASRTPVVTGPRQGRNDLCHCGSGRKFKKCHGA